MNDQDFVGLARSIEPLVEFRPRASEDEVAATELSLGVRLPNELRGFMMQSNGASIAVEVDSGKLIPEASPLVWSLNEIRDENRAVSTTDAGRARVLYFANAGVDGVLFGHPLDAAGAALDEVVAWYPIEACLEVVASSFGDFLDRWLRGSLTV